MVRIICLLIGYAFGLFQTSYIYGRTKGLDIREHGSGNAGTTNALRTLGKKAGAITLAGDCIKCILAVLTVRLIFGASHPEILKLLTVYAAAGTILGHNFPLYLGFRGGKGIAATAGLIISFDWRITLVCAALFFLNLAVTHYVSLGSRDETLDVCTVLPEGKHGKKCDHHVHLIEIRRFQRKAARLSHDNGHCKKDNVNHLLSVFL